MTEIQSAISHEYLFEITEKNFNSVIFDLGIKYNRIVGDVEFASLYNDYSLDECKKISKALYLFLVELGFIDDEYLSSDGKTYFELMYIYQDYKLAKDYIKARLQKNPIINLIKQVFYGRGKVSVEQLRILINYHNIASREIMYDETTSLLILLNKYDVLTYDKKNKRFYFNDFEDIDIPIKQYYITPSTPFSNIYNMRKVIRACNGDIYWIDKHFRKEGLELILDGLAPTGVLSVTIISSTCNITQSARADYYALKEELKNRDIILTWAVIVDNTFEWHDRWIVAGNCCYNIPPVLSIIRGQRAEILKTDIILDVSPFLSKSIDIDSYIS